MEVSKYTDSCFYYQYYLLGKSRYHNTFEIIKFVYANHERYGKGI
ncbi:hypothetical protein PBAL39_16094 [Pedobacter sp. BAL39]|nr:hypothetical protein PBAL39_16094 [Pedobacter sp. BAL39]